MKHIFKRSTAWMLSLALILGLFAGVPGIALIQANAAEGEATVAEKNLLADYNADFEDYAIPNWTIEPGVATSRDKAVEGNAWSLKINVKDAAATSDAVGAVPGYTYNASVKVFGAGKLAVVFYNAAGEVIAEESAEATTEAWGDLTVAANAPGGTVKAALKLSATTADAVYFDNAAMAMGDMWVTTNLLNGGMEEWNEDGTSPKNWNVNIAENGSYAGAVAEEVEGRGKVAAFNRQNQQLQIVSDQFDVVGGMAYIFTVDMIQDSGAYYQFVLEAFGADGKEIDIETGRVDGNLVSNYDKGYEALSADSVANEWFTVAYSQQMPADAVTARIYLYTAENIATSNVKFDNFTVAVSNSLYDGSFESVANNKGMPSGHVSATAQEWINTNADLVLDGDQSLIATSGWAYSNKINVIPGETYSSTVMAKTTATVQSSLLINLIYFYDINGHQIASKQATITPTTDWSELTTTATAPAGAVVAKTMMYTTKGVVCYVDSQTFTQTTNVAADFAIANGDFETVSVSNHSIISSWSGSQYNNAAEEAMEVVYDVERGGYVAHLNPQGAQVWLAAKRFPAVEGEKFTASASFSGTSGYVQMYVRFHKTETTGAAISSTNEPNRGYANTIDFTSETTEWVGVSDNGTKNLQDEQYIKDGKITLTAPAETNWVTVLIVAVPASVEKAYTYADIYVDDVSLVKVCEHDFSGDAVVTAPTCGTEGTSVITCPDCGATSTTTTPATGEHAWDEGVVTEATCAKGGYTTYTCTVCGATKIADETAAGNHVWNDGVYTDPTTEADGYTTYTCTLCGVTKVELDEDSKLVVVAQIVRGGEVAGVYYTVAAALADLQDGDTLELLADVNEGFNLPASGVNNITFDGNDFTVNGVIRVQHGAESVTGLTIKNVVFDANNTFDGANPVSYLVISTGMHENLTILDCVFQNGSNISTYNTAGVKNLTITGCIFDGVSNTQNTATAIKLTNVENMTVTNNEILSVEWNAFQIGHCSGELVFTDNTINWNAVDNADGVFNLHNLTDAKITISGNAIEVGNANAQYPVVYVQLGATNVALILEDDVTIDHNGFFTFNEGNVYCTGHNDVDGVCSICGTKMGPETDANLKFFGNVSLSFAEYICLQILFKNSTANDYDRVWAEVIQVDPTDGETVSEMNTIPLSKTYTVYDYPVMAWSMAEKITITLYGEKEGVIFKGQVIKTSVEELALGLLASYKESGDTKNAAIVADLLNYGIAVQKSQEHNVEYLPDLGEYADMATAEDPTLVAGNVVEGSGAKVYQIGLSMAEKIDIQIMFKTSAVAGKTFSAKLNGADVDYETIVYGSYTIYSVAIYAYQMRETFVLGLYNADGTAASAIYTVSTEGYAAELLENEATTDVVKELVIAMMRYGDGAASLPRQ